MNTIMTYTIPLPQAGQSIGSFLSGLGYSEHLLRNLRRTEGAVLLNGAPAYTTRLMQEGQTLTICLPEESSSEKIVPTSMELDIRYEDRDIMIINKRAGVPIHPSQGNFSNTLANGIAFYQQQTGQSFPYRVINRLDRDTTGLLILAKHSLSACILSRQITERKIHRQYLAIASGRVPLTGTIDAPIARVDGSTIERCVDFFQGESARTHYRCLSYNPKFDCSLVLLKLDTGRTHQIRVHMGYIGHPLPGDFLYYPDYHLIRRQALHSFLLDFSHPITGKDLHFQAPLPEDMSFMSLPENMDQKLFSPASF